MRLGHFTKRVRSRPLGRISLPMEKFLSFFEYKGKVNLQEGLGASLVTFLAPTLAPPFAGAFPAGSFFPSLGYEKKRRWCKDGERMDTR
jgi:hypothetical protein